MKGILYYFSLILTLLLSACSSDAPAPAESKSPMPEQSWEEILEEAKGQQVNMYMWGGSDSVNRYIDEWVAPRLQEETGVELRRVPVADIKDTVNQLLVEKKAGKEEGSMDILWINGENFKFAKENGLLAGPITEKLPHFQQYVDGDADDVRYDFGLDTEGYEAPWGKAQFVFVYDEEKIPSPPRSMEELKQWVIDHPGKFTYPAPPDFTGSAFLRHALFQTTGGYEQYMVPFSEDVTAKWEPLWDYLNEWEPYLWREGKTYPESLAKLDQLYANGEVWMTMGYDPARASNEIQKGTFPKTTKTFVLNAGTLSNTHYLAIPFHSTKQAGALAAINFFMSPDAQIAKFDPAYWGEDMALDPAKLSADDRARLDAIDRGPATLSTEELASHRLPEIPADYVNALEKAWLEHVAKP